MRDKLKNKILEHALLLAQEVGIPAVTRDWVAKRADVSTGSVSSAFGGIGGLKEALVAEAVKRDIRPVVVQGYALGYESAVLACQDEKYKKKLLF